MKPSLIEFQRAGLLAVLSQFATNQNIDPVTQLSIKQATLSVLDDHPIGDEVENKVRALIQ